MLRKWITKEEALKLYPVRVKMTNFRLIKEIGYVVDLSQIEAVKAYGHEGIGYEGAFLTKSGTIYYIPDMLWKTRDEALDKSIEMIYGEHRGNYGI